MSADPSADKIMAGLTRDIAAGFAGQAPLTVRDGHTIHHNPTSIDYSRLAKANADLAAYGGHGNGLGGLKTMQAAVSSSPIMLADARHAPPPEALASHEGMTGKPTMSPHAHGVQQHHQRTVAHQGHKHPHMGMIHAPGPPV